MSAIRIYNVEAGMPTLDDARRLVIGEIKRAKRDGVKVLKVIHGYGSSGKGGALCVGLRKSRARILRFSIRRCWIYWKPCRSWAVILI